MATDPSPDADTAPPNERAFLRRFVLLAVSILIALLAGYWFFLRTAYEPILSDVPADEAAAIVNILDERKIDYRLADGGTTILVAEDAADMARLELVDSELPIRGQVGFELFNQSDMGLTEFAQKINYQRALQGELARTIMLLDGIRSVRVHLGLPERSLFRDEQALPKASITLILQPGARLTESRVSGIQSMVAGAIPEMTPTSVAVLDGTGKVVSRENRPDPLLAATSDVRLAEIRERVSAAIEAVEPSLRYSLTVLLKRIEDNPVDTPLDEQPEDGHLPPSQAGSDRAVLVRVTTSEALDDGRQFVLREAIEEQAALDDALGDEIRFLVGEVVTVGPAPSWSAADRIVSRSDAIPAGKPRSVWANLPVLVLVLVLLTMLGALLIRLLRKRGMSRSDARLTSFAAQLRERLALSGGSV